jgi:hypothetical protein
MGDATVNILLKSTADVSGAQQMTGAYDEMFAKIKAGVTDALSAQGASPELIAQAGKGFDDLRETLNDGSLSAVEMTEKVNTLGQSLMDAAAAEKKLKDAHAVHTQAAHGSATGLRGLAQAAMQVPGPLGEIGHKVIEVAEGIEHVSEFGKHLGPAFAGLAPVISIAVVALSLLWEKFGGAEEAKEQVDKAKEAVNSMHEALKSAGEESNKLFKFGLDKYVADVERASGAWQHMSEQIDKAFASQAKLAKVQTDIANHQMEISRQNELAGANTDEERKAINTKYDSQKGALNDASGVDQAKMNLEANKAQEELLRRQHDKVEAEKNDAMGKSFKNEQDQKGFVKNYGDQSDQARRVKEAEGSQRKLKELQDQRRSAEEYNTANPTADGTLEFMRRREAEKLKEQIDSAAQDRDAKNVGLEGDKEAVKTGKGLKFDRLKDDAKKAGDSKDADEKDRAPAMAAHAENVANTQKQLEEERLAQQKALNESTAKLAALEKEQVEKARERVQKVAELEAAELKAIEGFAKAGTSKVTADKQAADKLKKEQEAEQARKLENDAKELELKGDKDGAAKKRDQLEKYKLPDNATDEQKRQVELDRRERAAKAKQPDVVDGREVAGQADNIVAQLGGKGKNLAAAAAKLKDGATAKELDATLSELAKLMPEIGAKINASDKSVAELKRGLEELRSQFRNSQS